jgi:hypothetical protein
MTDRDFTYWLQGFFEVSNPSSINEEQTQMIKAHLDLVFTNVTRKPNMLSGTCGAAGSDSDLPICSTHTGLPHYC